MPGMTNTYMLGKTMKARFRIRQGRYRRVLVVARSILRLASSCLLHRAYLIEMAGWRADQGATLIGTARS
jgi:hypothetical protein